MSDQFRHWLITLWPNYKNSEEEGLCADELHHICDDLVDRSIARYICWQGEETPSTGKEHIQLYIEFYKSVRINNVINYFDSEYFLHPHCESRKAKRQTARDYCRKKESRIFGPFEHGVWRKPKKEDAKLQTCAQLIEIGFDAKDIAYHRPDLFLRYGDRIDKCLRLRYDYILRLQAQKKRDNLLAKTKNDEEE